MSTATSPVTAPRARRRDRLARLALLAALLAAVFPMPARAQWVTTHEQFYLQAPHNWVFRDNYQAADRLFNAFDYGHAILYETLWDEPNAPPSALEVKTYDFLTKKVLVRPPRVPLEEAAIEIRYAQLAPEAKQMFEWAHILHRQIYDVLADERLDQAAKDREVQRLIDYYKTRRDVAFSSRPKSMALMQQQRYSLSFRKEYPKFNGLIWAYHWLQVGLYEPLVVGRSAAERQTGVRATVARFWQMLQDPPRTFPYQMPMTAAIAPTFSARYPEAAIIFDNLHSMHDVISDILANDSVPRDRKRAEIVLAARRYRDDTSYVMTPRAWLTMAQHMGIENMGGPAVNFLPVLPTPTVTYGAVMEHDDSTGEMTGFGYGRATGGAHAGMDGMRDTAGTLGASAANAHAGHRATPPAAESSPAPMDHAAMGDSAGGIPAESGATTASAAAIELYMRLMNDPEIRRRVMADTAMHRLMREAERTMPAEQRRHLESLMHGAHGGSAEPLPMRRDGASSTARPATRRVAPAARPSAARPAPPRKNTAPAARPTPRPAVSHAGRGAKPAAGQATPARTPAATAPRDSMAGMDHAEHPMPPRRP